MRPALRLQHRLSQGLSQVVAGAVDALTTHVVERAGFGALSFAGAGFSYTRLGSPDVGFATPGEVAWRVGSVVRAMGLPVLVEGDGGYGGPFYVMRTARLLEAAVLPLCNSRARRAEALRPPSRERGGPGRRDDGQDPCGRGRPWCPRARDHSAYRRPGGGRAGRSAGTWVALPESGRGCGVPRGSREPGGAGAGDQRGAGGDVKHVWREVSPPCSRPRVGVRGLLSR